MYLMGRGLFDGYKTAIASLMSMCIMSAPINTCSADAAEESKLIALTFDDGPNTTTTCQVLDLLEANDAKATFFLIGTQINEESASSVKRAYDMGCEIGNHSKTHSNMPALPDEEILAEIQYVDDYVMEITGESTKYFRAPFIDVNDKMYELIDKTFICGKGCNDFMDNVTAEERAEAMLEMAEDGVIYLLHDANGNTKTVEALETVIPELKEQGYEFVTLTELFERQGETPKNNIMYDRVSKYPCAEYTQHRNIYTGEAKGDSSWSGWGETAVFDPDELTALGTDFAVEVKCSGTYPPVVVLQRWNGTPIWCPVQPEYYNGEKACIMGEDITAALEAQGVTYSDLDKIVLYPYNGTLTVTSVDLLVKTGVSEGVMGDINEDGSLTIIDAVMLQKFIVISATLNDSQLKIADITGDGNVNVFDLVLMKSMLTGSLK